MLREFCDGLLDSDGFVDEWKGVDDTLLSTCGHRFVDGRRGETEPVDRESKMFLVMYA